MSPHPGSRAVRFGFTSLIVVLFRGVPHECSAQFDHRYRRNPFKPVLCDAQLWDQGGARRGRQGGWLVRCPGDRGGADQPVLREIGRKKTVAGTHASAGLRAKKAGSYSADRFVSPPHFRQSGLAL
jgi:hypothetical protein